MYNQPSGHSGVMDLYCTSAANAQFCGVICQQQTTLVSITLQLLCHFLVFICVPKLFFFLIGKVEDKNFNISKALFSIYFQNVLYSSYCVAAELFKDRQWYVPASTCFFFIYIHVYSQ